MKKKSKAQRAADAAFVAKLQSLTFGTGAKPKCSDCGKPIGGILIGPFPDPPPKLSDEHDDSFAA